MSNEIVRRNDDEGPRLRDLAGLDTPASDETTEHAYEKVRPDGTVRERGVVHTQRRTYAR